MRDPRILLAAGVALAVLGAGGLALTLVGGSGGAGGSGSAGDRDGAPRAVRAKLTLERLSPPDAPAPELLVSLSAPHLNKIQATGGARMVTLRCFDAAGKVAITRPADWPLLEEPGYPPHIHQPAVPRLLNSIRACRLTGPGIDFEGRMSARTPAAQ